MFRCGTVKRAEAGVACTSAHRFSAAARNDSCSKEAPLTQLFGSKDAPPPLPPMPFMPGVKAGAMAHMPNCETLAASTAGKELSQHAHEPLVVLGSEPPAGGPSRAP